MDLRTAFGRWRDRVDVGSRIVEVLVGYLKVLQEAVEELPKKIDECIKKKRLSDPLHCYVGTSGESQIENRHKYHKRVQSIAKFIRIGNVDSPE